MVTAGCLLLIIATIASSLLFACTFQERGSPLVLSAFMGAACGVVLVWLACALPFATFQIVWRKTRGYPFAIGDMVEITGGDKRGRHGRVRSHDQGVWHFQGDDEDKDGRIESHLISAGRLGKVSSRHESSDR